MNKIETYLKLIKRVNTKPTTYCTCKGGSKNKNAQNTFSSITKKFSEIFHFQISTKYYFTSMQVHTIKDFRDSRCLRTLLQNFH